MADALTELYHIRPEELASSKFYVMETHMNTAGGLWSEYLKMPQCPVCMQTRSQTEKVFIQKDMDEYRKLFVPIRGSERKRMVKEFTHYTVNIIGNKVNRIMAWCRQATQ